MATKFYEDVINFNITSAIISVDNKAVLRKAKDGDLMSGTLSMGE